MKRKFRNFKITRTCDKSYKSYSTYKNALRKDFKGRCAYCNLLESSITTPFEVDHYIPRDVFKDSWPELDTLYENLIFSCKKCNIAKSNQFTGDISTRKINNEDFYNPAEVDYGEIFYRNDSGGIDSDEPKGKNMITKLKLYKPIHNMAWLCECINNTIDKIDNKITSMNEESPEKNLLIEAKGKLNDYYRLCNKIFQANYNNDKFKIVKNEK